MIADPRSLSPDQLVEDSPELGSPPLVYQRLVDVINHPRGGAGDVANVIRQDTALTARLLKLVNSAFFSFPKPIETVSQAVSIVGTSQVRDLALATSVMDLFDHLPADIIDVERFWKHSLACGVAARIVAGVRREANVERFLVAGILHDIGRLILFLRVPERARAALQQAAQEGSLLHEVEQRVMGFDHGAVGGALMRRWNMPQSLAEALSYHHDPIRAQRYPAEAAIVHVADVLVNALEFGSSGESLVPPISNAAWSRLSLDAGLLPTWIEEMDRQYAAALHMLGLYA